MRAWKGRTGYQGCPQHSKNHELAGPSTETLWASPVPNKAENQPTIWIPGDVRSKQGPSPPRKIPVNLEAKAPRKGPKCGANYRIRTCDLLITNQLLYQLS